MDTSASERGERDFWLVRLLDRALRDDLGLRTAHRVRAGLVLLALLLILAVGVPVLLTVVGRRDAALALGVVFVVVLGAGGLVCRGIGEHKGKSAWKSTGYFLGAAAYGATATVSLINGVHRLLAG